MALSWLSNWGGERGIQAIAALCWVAGALARGQIGRVALRYTGCMSRGLWSLRFALMCCLALALSVQGLAAHAMRSCAPTAAPASQQAAHQPCADLDQAAPEAAADNAKIDPCGPCGAASACCMGVALIAAPGFASAPPFAQPRAQAALVQGHGRLLIGGLERPPKSTCSD